MKFFLAFLSLAASAAALGRGERIQIFEQSKSLKSAKDFSNAFVPRRYYVELNEPALIAMEQQVEAKKGAKISQVQYRSRLKDIRSALKSSLASLQDRTGKSPKVVFEYDLVWSGVVVDAGLDLVEKMASLAGVKAVHPVGTVKMPSGERARKLNRNQVRDSYLPDLGVPEVWSTYGLEGQGQTIAIVDTGIDYRHPDLGGCLGAGCKVIGGYDLVNRDADPLDDQSHGTHVAGIAAGSGKKMGVAPKANLLAYKVLDADGAGSFDTVIRGTEMALDPNGDGVLDDAADIISLSLGGPGVPTDQVAIAMNYAASYSVVVAAAGNDATFGKIGTPAAAEHVIAVAASDSNQRLAEYSSVGPTETFTLKPDITAPGTKIISTLPKNEYGAYSGTSMATPFISGMAALILQNEGSNLETRAERAKYVRSRLADGASPLEFSRKKDGSLVNRFFYIGQGLVNPKALFSSSFPLRLDNAGRSEVFRVESQTVSADYIVSMSGKPTPGHTYSVEFESGLGQDAIIKVNPQSFTAESTPRFLRIGYEQASAKIPESTTYPYAVGGVLKVTDQTSGKSIRMPVSLFRKSVYEFSYDRREMAFDFVYARPGTTKDYVYWWPEMIQGSAPINTVRMWVEPGQYSILARGSNLSGGQIFDNFFAEDVDLTRSLKRDVSLRNFVTKKSVEILDQNGFPTPSRGGWAFTHKGRTEYLDTEFPSTFRTNLEANDLEVFGYFNKSGVSLAFREFVRADSSQIPAHGYSITKFTPKTLEGTTPGLLCNMSYFSFRGFSMGVSLAETNSSIAVSKGDETAKPIRWRLGVPSAGTEWPCQSGTRYEATVKYGKNWEPVLKNSQGEILSTYGDNQALGQSTIIPNGAFVAYGEDIYLAASSGSMAEGERARVPNHYSVTDDTGREIVSGVALEDSVEASLPSGTKRLTYTQVNPDKTVRVVRTMNVDGVADFVSPNLDFFLYRRNAEGVDFKISYSADDDSALSLEMRPQGAEQWETVSLSQVDSGSVYQGQWKHSQGLENCEFRVRITNPQAEVLVEGKKLF